MITHLIIRLFLLTNVFGDAHAGGLGDALEEFCHRYSGPVLPLAKLGPRSPPEADLHATPEFLKRQSLTASSPEFSRWMSRREDSALSPEYLVNAHEALIAFDAWFRAGNFEPFEKEQDQLHLMSALGSTLDRVYYNSQPGNSYHSGDLFPGLNRTAAKELGSDQLSEKLRRRETSAFRFQTLPEGLEDDFAKEILRHKLHFALQIPIEISRLRKLTPLFPPRPSPFALLRKGKIYTVSVDVARKEHGPGNTYQWFTQVRGLEKYTKPSLHPSLPFNFMRGGSIIHFTPEDGAVRAYLNLARDHLQNIHARMRKGEGSTESTLDAIADYYHVLINAHPYYRINNSLFMNQTNYLLRMNGYRAVLHADLDYWANALGTDEFRRLFHDHVHESQAE